MILTHADPKCPILDKMGHFGPAESRGKMAKNKKLESRIQTLEYINWELRNVAQTYGALATESVKLLKFSNNLAERQEKILERVMSGESATGPKS